MVYKIFISTGEDNDAYLAATQQALFAINEVALSAITANNLPMIGDARMRSSRDLIRGAEVFIGIYDTTYGDVPDGATQSHQELEFQFAHELNKPMLIFVMKNALEQADARQKAFLEHIMQHHVVLWYDDAEDLAVTVQVAMDNYRQTKQHRRKLTPPIVTFRDRVPPLPGQPSAASESGEEQQRTFEEQVEEALQLAEDNIEQIIRRALELHDAQRQVEKPQISEDFDNKITVSPLWGEPIRRSQFMSDIFMIMPFRERFNAVYDSVIRPVAADLNLTIKRGDEFSSTRGSIMQEVWAALNACKLVIVETTEINANVYYELGIAHTLGKPAILITQTKEVEELPFDLRHLRFLVYDDTIDGSRALGASLRQSIIWLMNDLDEQVPDV